MGFNVNFDDSDLQGGLNRLEKQVDKWWRDAREQMADTLLLISRAEVPHDTGFLQTTGHVFYEVPEDAVCVAYNTPYAAYVHEGFRKDGSHVIKHYQKGRKKKYLEDPLKLNIDTWNKIGSDIVAAKLRGKI